jgi:hypothetical protein
MTSRAREGLEGYASEISMPDSDGTDVDLM